MRTSVFGKGLMFDDRQGFAALGRIDAATAEDSGIGQRTGRTLMTPLVARLAQGGDESAARP